MQGQGHCQGQAWWSHLRPKFQSICLLFISWQSDHFWLRYSKFHIWPWKCKVKVMAKPDGQIWGLEFNRCVCLSFRGNRTNFGWDIANSILDLENLRSRSRRKSNQVIYRSGPTIVPKMKEIQKNCSKVIAWTKVCGRRRWRRTNRYKNKYMWSPPVYRGDLISIR